MPYTVLDTKAYYLAIIARVATAGRPAELAVAPDDTSGSYAVVYPLTDESTEGSLDDPTQIVVWAFQVTCVARSASGALWLQREVRDVLHGHTPVVAGISANPIELDLGSGISRDDAADPVLFFSTDRFVSFTSA